MRGIEANPLNIIRFICEIPFFRVFRYFTYNIMLCKYLMASRMTYQNIGPKASRKLQCVRLPDSEGRRVNILAKLPEKYGKPYGTPHYYYFFLYKTPK